MAPAPKLSGSKVSVVVPGAKLLDGVDIEVVPGEVLGLIGPNGAGKSTLLKVLAGVTGDYLGRVTIGGVDTRQLNRRSYARQVAFLPQDADVHWPLSVLSVVELGRLPHRRSLRSLTADDVEAVRSALRRTETEQLQHRTMDRLSGGERMRALVARLLAVQADVVLADEPVAGLDPYFQLEFMDLFAEEARQGRAVVLVLHDLALAARYCDRLLLLHAGKAVAQGPPPVVLTEHNLQAVYRIEALSGTHQTQPYVVPWRRI